MTDTPSHLTDIPQDPRRVLLSELDREGVTMWVERHDGNPRGRWRALSSPDARASNRYHVCAQLQGGEWVRVMWGSGNPTASGVIGHKGGGGRPAGRKNGKPRADKGVPRGSRK